MDEWTIERFGPGVPTAEARRRPRPLRPVVETPAEVIERRRQILNGDLDTDELRVNALVEHRRLAEVIREYA